MNESFDDFLRKILGNDNGSWNFDIPEELFYVPGDLKIFTYDSRIIDADEIFKLKDMIEIGADLSNKWKTQASNWLKDNAPEFAEDEEDIFDSDSGIENFNDYFDESFIADETEKLWQSHPILLQARAEPHKSHLVPDWAGTLIYALSALSIQGWITYEKHKSLKAYYVRAKV